MHLSSLKKRLGDILVDVGIITTEQLEEALETQKVTGEKLGTILAQKGVINEEVMIAFLGKQCGVSYVSLSEFGEIPQDILRSIPESVARHQMLVPLSKEGNTITVAMSDPFNVFAVDDIKVMTGHDVNVVIASESEIKSAIAKYYSRSHKIQPVIHNETATTSSDDIIKAIITEAVHSKASDVHIEPLQESLRIRFRIDGVLHEHPLISKKLHEPLTAKLRIMMGLADSVIKKEPQEGKIKVKIDDKKVDLIISMIPSVTGERITLRILSIDTHVRDISKLGFETETLASYKKNIESRSGLIIITSPVNSGKTTTLYSTLSYLNHPDRNIISVEEMVHSVLAGVTQINISPENGLSFETAINSALKHNPDIVMIDEIHGPAAASIAVDAAINGKLVLVSLPIDNTIGAVSHLINMGIEPFLISTALRMVLAQRLMRLICPDCKETYKISTKALQNIGISENSSDAAQTVDLCRGKGCPSCNFTGYKGMVAIYEILEMNEELSTGILKRSQESVLRQAAQNKGMIMLRQAAWRKVKAGVSTAEEMLRITKASE